MRCFPGPFEEAWAELNGQFPEGCSINPCADHPGAVAGGAGEEKKTVLIVGGGVAGLQAAVTARTGATRWSCWRKAASWEEF